MALSLRNKRLAIEHASGLAIRIGRIERLVAALLSKDKSSAMRFLCALGVVSRRIQEYLSNFSFILNLIQSLINVFVHSVCN